MTAERHGLSTTVRGILAVVALVLALAVAVARHHTWKAVVHKVQSVL
jgi:hypothetical protein